jgi:hypothetical protein
MGTLRGDNGGERPPDGGGLPDLPPEWGTIVIPDNAAALDHEAELVRKEMRRQARRNRWRRRFGLPPLTHGSLDDDTPALGLPLLIMSIAIIATLTSLFAIAWPSRSGQSTGTPRTNQATAAPSSVSVPDLALHENGGAILRLRNTLPAVVLLVDGCGCADLITNTAQAVDPRVTVLAVARTVPPLPSALPAGRHVRSASDENGTLRSTYGGSPPSTGVTVVLVKATGEVVTAIPDIRSVDSFRPYLSELT